MLTNLYKIMIAQKKYCELVLNNPGLLGELIKVDNGTMKPDCIIRNLQRQAPTLRRSMAFIRTLKNAGYTEEEIFETETASK